MPIRGLHPDIAPNRSGYLAVSPQHSLYWEESGNPDGIPLLYLHGGPGGSSDPKHRRFYDPRQYRIVLFDQRGCGRSRPLASLTDNDTWALVEDIEQLRKALGIERWVVCGGSWGSTLALAYAQNHAHRVRALLLRGLFTFTARELGWLYGGGAARLFPEPWQEFVETIPEAERDDLVGAYYRRLSEPAEIQSPGILRFERFRFARAWSRYECRLSSMHPEPGVLGVCERATFVVPFSRIECHYIHHRGFLEQPDQLITQLPAIADIPMILVHGRYDVVCPLETAWKVAAALPKAELRVVAGAGHSAFEPRMCTALIQAADDIYRMLVSRADADYASQAAACRA